MSGNNDATTPGDTLVRPLFDFWTSYLQQANSATEGMLKSWDGQLDPRAWQQQWLSSVSQSMDGYLRSPMFLQGLKSHIDSLISSKRSAAESDQANPSVSGEQALLSQLQSLEQSLQHRLTGIEQRLQAIETRLADRDG